MIIESFLDAVQDFARARGWEIDEVPADWLLLTSQEIALVRFQSFCGPKLSLVSN